MDGSGSTHGETTRIGRTLGGWRLEARPGEGQAGALYAARDGAGRRGRIIVAGRNLAASASAAGRWLGRLAHLRRAVEHPALVPCLDAGREAAACYAVEAEPGGPALAQVLQAQPVPWPVDDALALAIDLCGALAALHSAGLVHGALEAACIHRGGQGWLLAGSTWSCWARDEQRRRVAERETGAVAWLPAAVSQGRDPVAGDDVVAWGQLLHLLVHGHVQGDGPVQSGSGDALRIGVQAVIADALAAAGAADADVSALAARLQGLQRSGAQRKRRPLLLLGAGCAVAAAGAILLLRANASAPPPAPAATPAPTAEAKRDAPSPAAAAERTATATASASLAERPLPPPPPPAIKAPAWAEAAGADRHGRWAQLRVAGLPLRLRFVPASSFRMGSDSGESGRSLDEEPREVRLTRGFWLAEHETTQALFSAVTGSNPSHFRGDDLPVERVSWDDVQLFLIQARRHAPQVVLRLPTEAEWELAARSELRHPGGNLGEQTRLGSLTTRGATAAAPSADGLHEMLGNVLEWVQDSYGPYDRLAVIDPLGRDGMDRVARGGAWNLGPASCRPAARFHYQAFKTYGFLGFRIAIDD